MMLKTKRIENPFLDDLPLLPLKLAVGFFVALKLGMALFMGAMGDEAYYWMWSQHLQWSYFDHPPLLAWLNAITINLFGNSVFGIRAWTLATTLGTLLIFRDWSRRLAGEHWEAAFWVAALVYFASPTYGLILTIAWQDHLLVFLCLLTLHFFWLFASSYDGVRDGDWRYLYAGAFAMGLAGLTKYNAVFLGAGLVFALVLDKRMRGLFRVPHLYAAGLLVFAMQAPVFWWNFTEGFASYRFHLSDRHGPEFVMVPHFARLGDFVLAMTGLYGPYLLWIIFSAARKPPHDLALRFAVRWAFSVFLISTLTVCGLALYSEANWWWNILAYALFLPFVFIYVRGPWGLAFHVIWGAAHSIFLFFGYVILPVAALSGDRDDFMSSVYGWDQVAAAVAHAALNETVDFIATPHYNSASQLGFALNDRNVTSLSSRHSQFDEWFDAEAHLGKQAILLDDGLGSFDYAAAQFDRVTLLNRLDIVRFGRGLHEYAVYLGEGFHGKR